MDGIWSQAVGLALDESLDSLSIKTREKIEYMGTNLGRLVDVAVGA